MPKDPAGLVGQYRGRLLIMGSAPSFWDDLDRYEKSFPDHDKMAINHVGLLYDGSFQHWASGHMDLPIYQASNTTAGLRNEQYEEILLHGKPNAKDQAYGWNFKDRGTSSMFGVKVGLMLGYEKITLAGIPLSSVGHFYAPVTRFNMYGAKDVLNYWKKVAPRWNGKVTSMSGFTRELLGAPQ